MTTTAKPPTRREREIELLAETLEVPRRRLARILKRPGSSLEYVARQVGTPVNRLIRAITLVREWVDGEEKTREAAAKAGIDPALPVHEQARALLRQLGKQTGHESEIEDYLARTDQLSDEQLAELYVEQQNLIDEFDPS